MKITQAGTLLCSSKLQSETQRTRTHLEIRTAIKQLFSSEFCTQSFNQLERIKKKIKEIDPAELQTRQHSQSRSRSVILPGLFQVQTFFIRFRLSSDNFCCI